MSGKLKEVRDRIKSVKNTQQITRAMKLVSGAKLRKAQDRVIQIRPYTAKLKEMLSNISAGADVNLKYAEERPANKILIVTVASDRTLCGPFNAQIAKLANQTIREKYSAQLKAGNVSLLPIGKRAYEPFKRRTDITIVDSYMHLLQNLTFDNTATAVMYIMDAFVAGNYDVVEIIYSQFKNAATQIPVVERMLPVPKPAPADTKTKADFIFQPDKESLLLELAPKILKTQLYKALLDSNASEHGARLTAMDKATNNAQDLIKQLSVAYNRARQATITNEILEVVSGANALSGG